jgi:pyruvate dehydrogenase E2 component (dihydrolipoamide acetyltransferase)
MIHEVFMPALSSTMTEGKIVSWLKEPGDKVEKGETVLVVESDKADMDVEAFHEGFLATIITPAEGTAPVGEVIALIAETQEEIEVAKQQAQSSSSGAAPSASPSAATATATKEPVAAPVETAVASTAKTNGRVIASPRAKKLAKKLNVDLKNLRGSGPHGRIVAADVEASAGVMPATSKAPSVVPASAPAPVSRPPAPSTPIPAQPGEVAAFNTLQQAVVRSMTSSLEAPTFRVGYTITTDDLDALYKQIKSKGVTMTALLAKAVAVTLQKHPLLNASYTEAGTQYRQEINVAVAVAMDGGGLITPVLRQADQLDIYSLSRMWKDLVARSRTKQLQPDEYSTGTFTVSNLGMFGVDRFDAILPPGQGSILAIGASRPQVVAMDNGLMGVRRQMQVNITCDHRIIYGAHAAAFLQDLAALIETNPQSLTL